MLVEGYRIVRKIGQGGMATVYRATQLSLNRPVALKILSHGRSSDFSERFLREARVIASLTHRHIVRIYDIGIAQERHYISMEYLTGGDLRARISNGISKAEAFDIVDKIGSALQKAHEQRIIHRDVKPSNILFRKDGSPVLTDFGVAKHTDASTLLTNTGAILGTPAYLSPEHAHGTPIDGRADMYSLGIVLYEMLTGERPYEGDSDISTIFKHAYDPLPVLPKQYEYLQPFLNKLLAKRREDRFEDIAALRSALREITQRPSETERAGKRAVPRETKRESDGHGKRMHKGGLLGASRRTAALAALAVALTVVLIFYPSRVRELVVDDNTSISIETEPGALDLPREEVQSTDAPTKGESPGESGPVSVEEVKPENQPLEVISKSEPISQSSPPRVEEVPAGPEPEATPLPLDAKSRAAALVELGNQRLTERKTLSPEGDSALHYFRLARKLDPGNVDASSGLYRVASHYADLAEQQLQMRRYSQAQQLVNQGLNVYPGHPQLRALNRRVKLEATSRKALRSLEKFADEVVEKIKGKINQR